MLTEFADATPSISAVTSVPSALTRISKLKYVPATGAMPVSTFVDVLLLASAERSYARRYGEVVLQINAVGVVRECRRVASSDAKDHAICAI
jgi:hypothetical protein